MKLDTLDHSDTPEGIALTLPVAGPLVRWLAWCIDFILVCVIWMLTAMILAYLGAAGVGIFFLVAFCITWFYSVSFEVLRDGATPGKKSFGLQVVHDDGTPVGFQASWLRNLLRTADFLPFAFAGGLLSMSFDARFRRLGDRVAGTLVVHRERTLNIDAVPDEIPLAPPVPLSPEERRAVVAFGSRVSRWSAERAEELASATARLTGAHGADGLRRLVGIANWILGRRGDT